VLTAQLGEVPFVITNPLVTLLIFSVLPLLLLVAPDRLRRLT